MFMEVREKCYLQCNLWRLIEIIHFQNTTKTSKIQRMTRWNIFYFLFFNLTKIYVEREMKRESCRIFHVCLELGFPTN